MIKVFVVTGSRVFAALLQSVILIVLARASTIEQFGQFSAVIAAGAVASSILNFGVSQATLRVDLSTAVDNSPIARGTATALGGLAALATLAVAFILGLTPLGFSVGVTAAAVFSVLSDNVSGINQTLFFRADRVKEALGLQIAVRTVPFLAVLLCLLLSWQPFEVLWIAYLAAAVLAMAVSGRMSLRPAAMRALIRSSLHYWRQSLWAVLRQLDTVIIAFFLGAAPTGAYAASTRLASPLHIVTQSVTSIFVPQLSREGDLLARRATANRMMLFGAGYTALILLLSPLAAFIGPLLLGKAYEPYGVLFTLAIAASGLNVLAQLLVATLFAHDDARAAADLTRTTTILALLLILGSAFLHSVLLVAVSAVVVQLVLVPGLYLHAARRRYLGRRPIPALADPGRQLPRG